MAPKERYLFIGDPHIPFEARHALKFCRAVQREFKIPAENIYCTGDEVDQYFGSAYLKDPDAIHTATSELRISREKIREWGKAFPHMKLCISNHGLRWAKRASEAQLPSQMIRPYQEIIMAPETWKWAYEWNISAARAKIKMLHGMGYSGVNGHRNAAIDNGCNTVIGHLHASGGVAHVATANQKIWALNAACLVDVSAYVFNYGRESRNKPTLGIGVVVDGGMTPIFVPYERFL